MKVEIYFYCVVFGGIGGVKIIFNYVLVSWSSEFYVYGSNMLWDFRVIFLDFSRFVYFFIEDVIGIFNIMNVGVEDLIDG